MSILEGRAPATPLIGPGPGGAPVGAAVVAALRAAATAILAGALVGMLVGGVGGRLAMMLLAVLNDDATGRISDDGFRIGQLTASGTGSLLVFATMVGVFGGLVYLALRPLMVGPHWFRLASISVGPAVVVGAALVHVGGVDFRILDPLWLAVALFLVIPGLYAALVSLLVERWLRPRSWLRRARAPLAIAPIILAAPIAPLVGVFAVGWLALQGTRQVPSLRRILAAPSSAWLARAGLAAVFTFALFDLVRDVRALT